MDIVFISHCTKDREFVESDIVPFLESHSLGTWYAPDDIATAEEWERKIQDGLLRSNWFLVVLSPDAIGSDWVRAEVHWAMDNRQGRVIPVLYRDCNPADLHLKLRRIQHVDFRGDRELARSKLLQCVKRPTELQPETQGRPPVTRYELFQSHLERSGQLAMIQFFAQFGGLSIGFAVGARAGFLMGLLAYFVAVPVLIQLVKYFYYRIFYGPRKS